MNRLLCVYLAACLCGLGCSTNRVPVGEPTPPPADGFVNLLDEEHAPQWKETGGREGIFDVRNGILHIPGSFGGLKYVGYTGETFGDFQLHLEFKLTTGANSGVILRGRPERPHHTGLEVQVLDSHGKQPTTHTAGAVYDVVTPMFEMSRPAGEWNSYDITFQGRHLVVLVNGWKVVDTDLSKMTMPIGKFDTPYAQLPLEGMLFFQDHHHEIWYRNVCIKRL